MDDYFIKSINWDSCTNPINDPVSVIHTYNEFFINKKEEITPLLDE